MSFNIFDTANGQEGIRIGYIDPERGYISANSIYEANLYASKNPGTTFILETRDRVRYLSINEVNKLTQKDIKPDEVACQNGIKGLRPGEVPSFPGGNQPLTVGGNTKKPIKVGGNGGTPVTSGGNGGQKVIAGGQKLKTSSGSALKVGGSGGTPVFLGGTGGEIVFLNNDVLTIDGTEVRVGSEGGIPLKLGGSGGTKVTTDGVDGCEGKIYISGGGGVGAYAVPIFGTDGSLLSAIVTDGGFGYKTPPQSRVHDTCNRGVGAVLKTYIDEIASTVETYEEEEDFEIYNLTPPNGGVTAGYGNMFGVDGQSTGEWDPNLFASLKTSPIKLQIKEYQEFLAQGISPWWHTRKEQPIEITFGEITKNVKNDVRHWKWGGKSITTTEPGKSQPPSTPSQYEELEFEVFTQGGNQVDRDLQFNFTSEDGKHKFQFKAPEFKDNRKTKVKRKVKRNTVYKVVASGKHKGKGVEQGLIAGIGRGAKEIKGNKKGKIIFADFVRSANDNDDLQVRATQGMFTATGERKTTDGHSTNDLTYKFESNKDFKPTAKKPAPPQKKVTTVVEDSFMNRYAISPVPASNAPGSDYAGRTATFIWREEFPYSGDYKFRGMADNIGKIYIDNELVLEERKFKGDPARTVSKYITAGIHDIRVDLYNIPVKEKIVTKLPQSQSQSQLSGKVPVKFDVYGEGKRVSQIINYVFTSEDGKDSFTFKPKKTDAKRYSYSRTVNVLPNINYNVQAVTGGSGSTSREYEYKISVANRGRLGRGINAAVKKVEKKTIKFTDSKSQNDTDAEFKILPGSPGVTAEFRGTNDDDLKLVVKGSGGDLTLQLKWDDDPNSNGKAVGSLKIAGETFKQTAHKDKKGDVTKTINLGGSRYNSSDRLEQGTLKRDTFKKSGKESSSKSNVIFADITTSTNDNDDMQIRCGTGEFTSSNKRKIDGHSTYDLKFRVDVNVPTGSSSGRSTQSTNYGSIFNTVDYINKADRKLWRTNVYGRGGFLNDNGICPFDTKNPLPDNPYAGSHIIRWEHINFPEDGNYDITVDADDSVKIHIGNRDGDGAAAIGNGLIPVEQGGDEVFIENGMKMTTHTKFFKKGKYRIRAELTQIPGGVFSFDENGVAGGPNVTARFIERDGQKYLKVEGSGSAEIHFRLKTDDNPRTSGVFASKIRIGKGPNDSIELKRSPLIGSRLRSKETITGSAFFESGREYLVKTFDTSRTTGSIIKNNGESIQYDDDIANGFDWNGELKITNITNQQKPKVKGINPMALAIDIRPRTIEQTRISPKSWQENPMGAAFTIDAPLPPIPQEPKPEQEGRCPNNPLWTTRFEGASESWWPVNHKNQRGGRTWSKFMNRFAMSPLPPLATPSSDGGGGITYSNSWTVDFPYTGFYGFKGTSDNTGRILVDGQEVYKLRGFSDKAPKIEKQKVRKGKHEVTVEVRNEDQRKRSRITKEIFNTRKWQKPLSNVNIDKKIDVNFKVTTDAKFANSIRFGSGDGPEGFFFEKAYAGSQIKETTTKSLEAGKVYDVVFNSKGGNGQLKKNYKIEVAPRGTKGRGTKAAVRSVSEKIIKFTDSMFQNDTDAEFEILSASPGVTARFRGSDENDLQLSITGIGDVTLQLRWEDDPNKNGKAVGNIKVAGETFKQTARQDREGDVTKTVKVVGNQITTKSFRVLHGGGTAYKEGTTVTVRGTSRSDIKLRNAGETVVEMEDSTDYDWTDLIVSASQGRFYDIKGNKCKFVVGKKGQGQEGLKSGSNVGGVTYTGPELFTFKYPRWSEFMNKVSVSPFLPPLDKENPAINGESRYKWSGVQFPENGRYDIKFQADDSAKLFINGEEIDNVEGFRLEPMPKAVNLSRGTYDIEVVLTNVPGNENIFNTNPSGFAITITKDFTIISKESNSWIGNPVGASAVIIPPPCPKKIEGTGVVTRIEVMQPGNSYPKPIGGTGGGDGIPVTLKLIDIVPDKPGIGYKPGDTIIIEPPGGPPIELTPTLDTFGRIINIPTKPPRFPDTPDGGGGDGGGGGGEPQQQLPDPPTDTGAGGPSGPGSFDIIANTDTQILQVTDLPGQIGVEDLTGVLIPLVKRGGLISPSTSPTVVPAPGPFFGFTEYPNIYPSSDTGLGFRGRPVFEVVVVPEKILPDEMVLQVVDIPGIRQTGYVNGKPYYGQVFARDGNLYAGVSLDVGELIPIYATLEASVLNQQTIKTSAILRSGSQTSDGNPLIK